jgi:hypothetical protein
MHVSLYLTGNVVFRYYIRGLLHRRLTRLRLLLLQTIAKKSAEMYKQYEDLVFDHLRSKFTLYS